MGLTVFKQANNKDIGNDVCLAHIIFISLGFLKWRTWVKDFWANFNGKSRNMCIW